jgi:hypothetical protein
MIELAQNSTTINQGNVSGSFDEGDSFMFESIVHGSSEAIDAPKILQVNIFATNILGQPIINFFAIRFTNDCGIYPVIDEGNSAGWVYFVSDAQKSCLATELRVLTHFFLPGTPDRIGTPSENCLSCRANRLAIFVTNPSNIFVTNPSNSDFFTNSISSLYSSYYTLSF